MHKPLAGRADEICFQFGRRESLRALGQSGQTTKAACGICKGNDSGTVKVAMRREMLRRDLDLPDRTAGANLDPLKT